MSIYQKGTPEGYADLPDPRSDKNKKEQSKAAMVWDFLSPFVVAVGIAVVLLAFVVINARIPTSSMEDTIMAGDRILGFRLAYIKSDPERYDIVVFRYPDNEKELFIKRVIGLPGETVVITDGKVYIYEAGTDTSGVADDELLRDPEMLGGCITADDSFVKGTQSSDGTGVYRVPADSYFMLGDNRNNSRDSRFWNNTYVSRKKILGKAILRYWPITEFKLLGNGES